MTPKEIAEVFSKPEPEHWQQGLAGRMHILAKAYLALESRIQKLEAVAEAARKLCDVVGDGDNGPLPTFLDTFNACEDALAELEQP